MLHSRHDREAYLPEWLWFFLVLPIVLILLLLYKRRRLPPLREIRDLLPGQQRPRYREPDSIPLDMQGEIGLGITNTRSEVTRMDAESPATANESSDIAAEVRTSLEPEAPRNPASIREENVAAERAEEPAAESQDDLTIIEGIGPSISGILRANGIDTFQKLADAPNERLVQILTDAGLSRLANPGTWPEQARLAAEGKWDALDQLQSTLKGGRRIDNG